MKNERNRALYTEWSSQQQPSNETTDKSTATDRNKDLEQLFYRNVVNVYAGPSGKFDENLL
jgi:long-subunit fatty acid transport protein